MARAPPIGGSGLSSYADADTDLNMSSTVGMTRARRHEDVADLPRREGVPAQPVAGGRHSSQAQTAVAQQPSATTNIH